MFFCMTIKTGLRVPKADLLWENAALGSKQLNQEIRHAEVTWFI